MNKKEQKMLDKVFNLDCYDQELSPVAVVAVCSYGLPS
jgi:hypothetical protein